MTKFHKNYFQDKKVLVFGLGLLGGGVATTNWLIKQGAQVTVTDLKSEDYLEPSLRRLRGKPVLKLNGHDKKDIEDNEVIVFNPDVSIKNPFVKYAQKIGRQIENEATIFYKLCPKPIIAVTGTRGKTTTASWGGHLIGGEFKTIVSGNSYVEPLLKTLGRSNLFSNSRELENRNFIVNEIPSYHLEYFDRTIPPPAVAVITNLYQDHLNRHGTMQGYAIAKAAIFKNQAANHNLILNHDNKWTVFLLKQKPRARVWFFSLESLPKNKSGVFYKNDHVYFQDGGTVKGAINVSGFLEKWGTHNLENLLASSLAAHFAGVTWPEIEQRIKTLPQMPFRQELVFDSSRLKVINDTSATSPDGGIAAVNRFASPTTILIAGGTDRQLDYKEWARTVKKQIRPENLILLDGSATDKMLKSLGAYGKKVQVFDTLSECVRGALRLTGQFTQSVILFSPAAKSFEKFKNEFDRGWQFNKLVTKLVKGGKPCLLAHF